MPSVWVGLRDHDERRGPVYTMPHPIYHVGRDRVIVGRREQGIGCLRRGWGVGPCYQWLPSWGCGTKGLTMPHPVIRVYGHGRGLGGLFLSHPHRGKSVSNGPAAACPDIIMICLRSGERGPASS